MVAMYQTVKKMFDTAAYIDSLDMFSIRLGLDSVKNLMQKAGNPEKSLRFIHIAGTNGKGSTGAMLERCLRQAGFVTGFYTSPHLIDIRERFRINGKAVSVENFNHCGNELFQQSAGEKSSYFEFATVLAMKIFAEAKVDVVIWETGLGGRLDATNAITPKASIITNIALDHQKHLGNTIEAVAGEKSRIIKPGKPFFHGVLPDAAKAVIYSWANEMNSEIHPPRSDVPEITGFEGVCQVFDYDGRKISLALPGRMQRENFRIVYEVLSYFAEKWNFSLEKALDGLKEVRWPARFQHIGQVIIDGGHNPDGVKALTEAVTERYPEEKFLIVYAAFGDKHAPECLKFLEKIADEFIFTIPGVDGRAAYSPEELTGFTGKTAVIENDPVLAVKRAVAQNRRRVIISGSLYLAGTALQLLLDPEEVLDI